MRGKQVRTRRANPKFVGRYARFHFVDVGCVDALITGVDGPTYQIFSLVIPDQVRAEYDQLVLVGPELIFPQFPAQKQS